MLFFEYPALSSSSNHHSSRTLIDGSVDHIMTTLYDLIDVATNITDMSVTEIMALPKCCNELVQVGIDKAQLSVKMNCISTCRNR